MEDIQFVGYDDLDDKEKAILNKLATEYHEKMQRFFLKHPMNIIIQIKKLKKEGDKQKYTIHARVNAPANFAQSSKAADWDFARTLHKAFKDLERSIEHKIQIEQEKKHKQGINPPQK